MNPKIVTEYLNGRKPADLLKVIRDQHVNYVIDIRFSDYQPEYFRFQALRTYLHTNYLQLDACGNEIPTIYNFHQLGNPPWNRPPKLTDFEAAKKNYLDYILNQQLHVLSQLIGFIGATDTPSSKNKVFCLICYCPTVDPKLCHRFWLQEVLEKRI